jgi:hypothetical protein
LVEGIAAFIQGINLCLAFVLVEGVFGQAILNGALSQSRIVSNLYQRALTLKVTLFWTYSAWFARLIL